MEAMSLQAILLMSTCSEYYSAACVHNKVVKTPTYRSVMFLCQDCKAQIITPNCALPL